mmetsp:Transcript_5189/g.15477  ORF Transcript_5189/g.15477 Transcript_5189/m.15477 type:complete len:207 (-) Transcript_5189:997-1617(-)
MPVGSSTRSVFLVLCQGFVTNGRGSHGTKPHRSCGLLGVHSTRQSRGTAHWVKGQRIKRTMAPGSMGPPGAARKRTCSAGAAGSNDVGPAAPASPSAPKMRTPSSKCHRWSGAAGGRPALASTTASDISMTVKGAESMSSMLITSTATLRVLLKVPSYRSSGWLRLRRSSMYMVMSVRFDTLVSSVAKGSSRCEKSAMRQWWSVSA